MRLALTSTLALLASLASLTGCADDPPYLTCSREARCASETNLCLSSTTASGNTVRFCSARCLTPAATSSECPGNAACIRLNGGDPVCVPRCSAVSDCPFDGAACSVLGESLGARVCSVRP